jgi:hypothetical protein
MCGDGAGTTTKMLTTDDRGHVPATYREFVQDVGQTKAETLPPHWLIDHANDLELRYNWPYGRIYNLSELDLTTLTAYIEAKLAIAFIQRSSSPAAAAILFAKQNDGGLRLFVDSHALNLLRVKNRYPLPGISEMLERVRVARIFTKLDHRSAYNLLKLKEGDELKTTFRTRYSELEYRVMQFGLRNTLATFQSYINDCLQSYIDAFMLCYLNDILIYLTNKKDHEEYSRQVRKRLRHFGLYCKA